MRIKKNIITVLVITLLLSIINLTVVHANSAEPPGFTVIVTNAPNDLTIIVNNSGMDGKDGSILSKQKKGWESHYKFYYSPMFKLTNDSKLIVRGEGYNFECKLPMELFEQYNNVITLDLEGQSLTLGQAPHRTTILVVMRVLLTLIIEGGIFYLYGYRKRSSWIIFLITNLITQGALNLTITGPNLASYWFMGYFFLEIIIMISELIIFTLFLKESKKSKAASFAIVANFVSLILGGIIISGLPV